MQARRVSANAELKRLTVQLLRCLCHTFAGVVQISSYVGSSGTGGNGGASAGSGDTPWEGAFGSKC
jgi:hypothetical protein